MKFDSLLIKGLSAEENEKGSVMPPIYLSSTYVQDSLYNFQEFAYARGGNPTRKNLEKLMSKLDGVDYGFAFSSGMAATATVFNLFKVGDKILVNNNVYGGTYRYLDNIFEQQGLEYELIDDLNNLTEKDLTDNVKAIFIETPSNPLLRVTDIEKLVQLAHKKDVLVIVDNTFMTPYLQKPFEYGVDIVVYSATKYLSGHADLIAGIITVNNKKIADRIKFLQNTLGNILSPLDSYNLIKGIKTLAIRMDRQQENTHKIINYLGSHEAILNLYYPGSFSTKELNIQNKQAIDIGAVFSLELKKGVNLEVFVKSLKYFDLAVSLGGVESLICHPASMTHESYSKKLQDKIGISSDLLRLAIGIENSDDLIDDLQQALEKAL